MKNNTRRIYSEAEAEALRASYKWSAGVLQHEFDQETIDHCQAEIQAGIERIIRGESTQKEEFSKMLDDMAQEIGVLGTPNSDISAVNAEVIRLQDEAAQKPDHWLHDGLKSHFEEIQQQLSDLKR